MAKTKDAPKDPSQEGKTAEPKKGDGGSSKTFMLLFSVAMIVQLIIIVILVYFVLNQNKSSQPVTDTQKIEKSSNSSESTESEGGTATDEHKETKKEEGPVIIYQTDDLIINPKGSGGRRYLMTQIGIAVPSEEVKKEFEEGRKAQLNDILSQYLASKTIDELVDIDRRDSIKLDLKKILNKEIGGKKVKNIFFSKFVVQ
jgi:flagellar FliL protein